MRTGAGSATMRAPMAGQHPSAPSAATRPPAPAPGCRPPCARSPSGASSRCTSCRCGRCRRVEFLAHRIVWCCLLVFAWLGCPRRTGRGARRAGEPGLAACACSARPLFISVNWLTYIWAVTHDHVIDASLGYFINPLLSVRAGRARARRAPQPDAEDRRRPRRRRACSTSRSSPGDRPGSRWCSPRASRCTG